MLDKSKLNLYAKRLLNQINSNLLIKENVLNFLDQILTRFIKIIIRRSSGLVKNVKKNTITIPDLEASIKLEFPNSLAEKILKNLLEQSEEDIEKRETIVPSAKIKLKMKKYAETSRISKQSVQFCTCLIEDMLMEILRISVDELKNTPSGINGDELLLDNVIQAFHHNEKDLVVLLEL